MDEPVLDLETDGGGRPRTDPEDLQDRDLGSRLHQIEIKRVFLISAWGWPDG